MGGFFSPVVPVRVVPPPPTPPPAPYEITDWETRDRTLAPGTVGVYTPTSAIYVLTEIDDGAGGTILEWLRPGIAAGAPLLVGKIEGDLLPSAETPAWTHETNGTVTITQRNVGGLDFVEFDVQSTGFAFARIGSSTSTPPAFSAGWVRLTIDEGTDGNRARTLAAAHFQPRTGANATQIASVGAGPSTPARFVTAVGTNDGQLYESIIDAPGRWAWLEVVSQGPRDNEDYAQMYLDHSQLPIAAVDAVTDVASADWLWRIGAWATLGGNRGQCDVRELICGTF